MTQEDKNGFVKILFRFFSQVLDEWTVETLWASTVDKDKGLYRIENIPFYASVACNDLVLAEYDSTEERLTYRETVEPSGNSVIQVVIMDATVATNDIRDILKAYGCPSEKLSERYFVVEVPADTDYKPVKAKLSALQAEGIIDYAEPVLSDYHWYEESDPV